VQDDERAAALALQLQQHEIIPRNFDGRKIHLHACSTLRTAHLFANAKKNLVEGVWIEIHNLFSIAESEEFRTKKNAQFV
jgi:hypothetical protein